MRLDIEQARYNEQPTASGHTAAYAGSGFHGWTDTHPLGLRDDDYPISEPVIFKDGLFVAPLLIALQAIAPAIITAGSLYVFAQMYEVTFTSAFKGLAIL